MAAEALAGGAYMVNDISALRMDPEMVAVVRDAECPVILMHMLGEPETMQEDPVYEDVVEELYDFFVERLNWAVDQGLKEENLLIDPDRASARRPPTTWRSCGIWRASGPWGGRSWWAPRASASWARYWASPNPRTGISPPRSRPRWLLSSGAHMLRVHNVGLNRDAARLAQAVPRSATRNGEGS